MTVRYGLTPFNRRFILIFYNLRAFGNDNFRFRIIRIKSRDGKRALMPHIYGGFRIADECIANHYVLHHVLAVIERKIESGRIFVIAANIEYIFKNHVFEIRTVIKTRSVSLCRNNAINVVISVNIAEIGI